MKQPLKTEFLQAIVNIQYLCRFQSSRSLPYLSHFFGVYPHLNSMGYKGKSTEVGL